MSRALRHFWSSATGDNGISTVDYLRRQLLWLLALTAIGGAALFGAYDVVHRDTAAIRDRTGPAVVELARAHTLLRQAHATAEEHIVYLTKNRDRPDILSLGEEYGSLLTEARQSLDRAQRTGALDRGDRQTLRIVSGLVDGYANRIDGAWKQYGKPELSRANLSYAKTMMYAEKSGVLDRITKLQKRQSAALDRHEDWGTAPLLAWPAAITACLLLGVRLVGTQVFLRRRFRLRLSIPLAAVTLLLAAVPVLAFGTWQAHACQAAVQDVVGLLEPAGKAAAPALSRQDTIDEVEARMAEAVRERDAGTWARVTAFIPPAGLLIGGVIAWTLQSHLAEYAVPRTRGGVRR
ncbi:hypothetical protein [Streptomyces spiramyceticus]|uniref:hypothetical protein n=1 Tax=Streptomyces spiramyceticus TaxID=299717 RepID=UPI00237C02FD|nr:hypothetical protein [Streptomyces spiramyceticus]